MHKKVVWSFLFLFVHLVLCGCATISPSQQYINLGQQCSGKGEHKEAITNYSKALELEPRNAMAHYHRAQEFHLTGAEDKAIADYIKALELGLDPKISYFAYENLGYLYLANDDYDQAISAHTKAIQTPPTPTTWWHLYSAYFSRSMAFAFNDDIENAIIDRKRAQEIVKAEEAAKPTIEQQLAAAAIGGFVGGLVGGAVQAKSEPLVGPSQAVGKGMGASLVVAKGIERGITEESFDQGKVEKMGTEGTNFSNADYAEIYEMRACRYFQKGKFDKAVSDYSRALELNPTGKLAVQVRIGRGEVFATMSKYDKALSDANEAIEIMSNTDLSGDEFVAYERLGRIYAAMGNHDQAIYYFNKGIEIAPLVTKVYQDRPFILGKRDLYFDRGLSYFKKGIYEQAITDYSQAVNEKLGGGGFGKAYYYRALAYYAKGEYAKAEKDVNRAQKLNYPVDPDFLIKINCSHQKNNNE